MIKAEELRIGNKIAYRGKVTDVEGVSEYKINPEAQSFTGEGGAYLDGIDNDYLEPIPLKSEILEKIGFKLTGSINFDYTTYHLLDNDCWLVNTGFDFDETIWGYFIQISSNKPEWVQVSEVRYLHQLQNLYFALTGEELEINL